MPELPEVETVCRYLASHAIGRSFEQVQIVDPRWSGVQEAHWVEDELSGRTIKSLQRRGKYMVWGLDHKMVLLTHLRMTGIFLVNPKPDVSKKHQRVIFHLSQGITLVFVDPRRFGTGRLLSPSKYLAFQQSLGVEPLTERFTPELLQKLVHKRKTPIKALLLNQRDIAGVGNIYADEALFQAGIAPTRISATLSYEECVFLHAGIVDALRRGLEAKGASIDDFRHPDGVKGAFQNQFFVHRRAGKPCPKCETVIQKTRVAGRGTYLCPCCQG